MSKTVLHVGCGLPAAGKLPSAFEGPSWREVRLDIDPGVRPDIVASITDLGCLAAGSVDAVFSAHNLEHLYPHEVPLALGEFRRVLRTDGLALVTMPDLQAVAALVAEGRLTEPAYISPMGPIAPLDMLYGHRASLGQGNLFMAHRTGFTGASLSAALLAAGFGAAVVQRQPGAFCLWAIGFAVVPAEAEMRAAQAALLPLKMPLDQWPTGDRAAA